MEPSASERKKRGGQRPETEGEETLTHEKNMNQCWAERRKHIENHSREESETDVYGMKQKAARQRMEVKGWQREEERQG